MLVSAPTGECCPTAAIGGAPPGQGGSTPLRVGAHPLRGTAYRAVRYAAGREWRAGER